MRNEVKEYLGAVEKELLCEKKQKKVLLERLKADVEAFLDEAQGECDASVLTAHFGTPQEVAAAVLRTTQIGTVQKKVSAKKLVIAVVTAACVIVVAMLAVHLWNRAKLQESIANGYYEEVIHDFGVVEGTPPPCEETDRVY